MEQLASDNPQGGAMYSVHIFLHNLHMYMDSPASEPLTLFLVLPPIPLIYHHQQTVCALTQLSAKAS
jgi:hypothetical protein